jgi:hypothetical protein
MDGKPQISSAPFFGSDRREAKGVERPASRDAGVPGRLNNYAAKFSLTALAALPGNRFEALVGI